MLTETWRLFTFSLTRVDHAKWCDIATCENPKACCEHVEVSVDHFKSPVEL